MKPKGRVSAAYFRERRTQFANKGLCTRCGGEREDWRRKSCTHCLRKMAERERAKRRPGLCSTCSIRRPSEGMDTCPQCRERYKGRYNTIGKAHRDAALAA